MSADPQDLMNRLQVQLAMNPPQPSIFGIQAPPNPQALQALLQQLRQQQYQNQVNAPTPGPYGYLHDAGKLQMNSVGQQLGNSVGNALQMIGQGQNSPPGAPGQTAPSGGQPSAPTDGTATAAPTTPQAAPGGGPQAAFAAAMQKGRAIYQAQIAANVPPDVAKVNTLKVLVGLGVPGADAQLDAANDAVLKNSQTQSETTKNTSQSKMDDADTAAKGFDQTTKQWKTTYQDPNGLFMLQTNGAGETKRVELKPPPSAAAQAAANIDPSSLQFAADTYRTTGKFPGSFGKSPALQMAVLKQVAADALANGDTAGSIAARTASLKAGGAALDQITKQEAFTGSAVNTLDANLKALQTIGSKVDDTGSPLANKVLNHWNQGVVSDPTTAAYVTMLNAVQGEYAKIASNNNGNSPISDAAKADAKDVINKAMSQGGVAAVAQAMRQESANRMQAIREAKQGLVGSLSGNAPGVSQAATGGQVAQGTTTAPPPSPAAPKRLVYNPATGSFN